MPQDLGRALLLADAVSPDALAEALFCSVRDRVSLVRALVVTQAIAPTRLEEELARANPDIPLQRHPVPVQDLLDKLPPHLCEAFVALPVRRDPRTGTVDVALADPQDAHAADEFSFFLGAPVRAVRSPLTALELALARVRSVERMRAVATGSSWPPVEEVRRPAEPRPRAPSDVDIPIPLSRRAPEREDSAAELVVPLVRSRGAETFADDEEPVVELRRVKTPSNAGATSLAQLLKEMARVGARDPLMELVLIAARPVARKTALFAVKRDAYVGWMCTSDFGDRGDLAQVSVPVAVPSFLAAAATVGQYVGPLLRNAQHEPFLSFMRSPRPEVVAIAIRAAARPAVILVAHDVQEQIKAMPVLHDIAHAAGDALERILLSRGSSPASRRV